MPLLADTMSVAWYVLAPERLTQPAVAALQAETDANRKVLVSAYTEVELVYMLEKTTLGRPGGITQAEYDAIKQQLDDPIGPFQVVPLDSAVARRVQSVPRTFTLPNGHVVKNADPGDRIIVATALERGVSVVTSDPKIADLSVVVAAFTVVW